LSLKERTTQLGFSSYKLPASTKNLLRLAR